MEAGCMTSCPSASMYTTPSARPSRCTIRLTREPGLMVKFFLRQWISGRATGLPPFLVALVDDEPPARETAPLP